MGLQVSFLDSACHLSQELFRGFLAGIREKL